MHITDFGALGDGHHVNTRAIQAALDACAEQGGGTVTIPPGRYLTGTLRMHGRTTLHLENGAVLLASGDLGDYPPIAMPGHEFDPRRSLLWAEDAESVAITGEGCIDLNDEPFMDWDTIKTGDTWEEDLLARADARQRAESTVLAKARPNQCLFFRRVRGLRIRDVTIRRAPCWTVCVHDSDDVHVDGVSIFNNLRVPNSDGIHLCCCRDAVIRHCVLHCGDDCVAITGISDWATPCEHIVVEGCTMISRSAGVRLGHLQSKVRNVTLAHLVIRDSQRGIGLFAGDGGCVEDVTVTGCIVQTRMICGHWWGNGEPLVISAADGDGCIRRVQVSNLIARGENGMVLCGRGGNVSDVHLEQVRIVLAYGDNRPLLGKWIDLQPAALREAPDARRSIPWLYARETGRVTCRGVTASADDPGAVGFSVEPDIDGSPVESRA